MPQDKDYYDEHELKIMGFKSVGFDVRVSKLAVIKNPSEVTIGNHVAIDQFVYISVKATIKSYIHIAVGARIIGGINSRLIMEDFSFISNNCVVICGSDDYLGSGIPNPTVPSKYRADVVYGTVVFKKFAGLGANSVVMPNVTIEEGTVTGACTLVTKSLESWGVYIGIPAKRMKDRPKEIMEKNAKELEETNRGYPDPNKCPEIPFEPKVNLIPIWVPPKQNKKIAVIVLTYNRPTLVKKTIESILAQIHCDDYHLYIIDNNSLPQVKKVLDEYIGKPNITIYTTDTTNEIRKHYYGDAVCVNLIWNLLTEKYVMFENDDCWAEPQKLWIMSEYLDNNPEVKIVYCIQRVIDRDGKIIRYRDANFIQNSASGRVDGNQVMFRRTLLNEAFSETHRFTCRYCDLQLDYNFFLRLSKLKIPLYPIHTELDNSIEHSKQLGKTVGRQEDELRE